LTAGSDACGGSTRLIVIDASAYAIDVLDHQMLAAYASWSPDGSSILYSPVETDGGAGIWQRPLQGGEPRLLTDVDVLLLDWSPDGERAAWLGRSADDEILGLWVMDLRDGSVRRIASGLLGSLGGSWPKWSSDSSWIAFLRPPLTTPADPAEPAASMWVIRTDGSGERLLLDRPDEPTDVFDVDW
jgi:Tol biopolymer transport system component